MIENVISQSGPDAVIIFIYKYNKIYASVSQIIVTVLLLYIVELILRQLGRVLVKVMEIF